MKRNTTRMMIAIILNVFAGAHDLTAQPLSAQLPKSLVSPESPESPESLTLEQKIGQMVMMGFSGTTTADPSVFAALEQVRGAVPGGVFFYGYDIVNPDQVRLLAKAFADANPFALPLPIAVDQEGGLVQRLKASNGFLSTPSAEDMAANYSHEGAFLA